MTQPITFELSSGPIAALRAGTAGPIVLLVPGFTGSKEDFAPLLAPIAAAGLTAYAIDLPGQYESPGSTDAEAYSTRALGLVLVELAHQLGGVVHLVGHSFGGLVARAAVLAAGSTNDTSAFASLVLMCSGPAALGGARLERMELLRPALAVYSLAEIYDAIEAMEAADPGHVPDPPELAAFYRRRFLANDPQMLLGMGDALSSEPDRVDELAAAGLRTLVLYGVDDDAWEPALQADMAQRLHAEHVVIPDAAHSPAVENPEPTAAALLRFWRAAERRAGEP
jgi:pimeloyl-ACP methyl ester carboxylesterase